MKTPHNDQRVITLGDILDLLMRDSTEVTLHGDDGNGLTGSAGSYLWKLMEGCAVLTISPTEDGLDICLDAEDGLPKINDDGNR